VIILAPSMPSTPPGKLPWPIGRSAECEDAHTSAAQAQSRRLASGRRRFQVRTSDIRAKPPGRAKYWRGREILDGFQQWTDLAQVIGINVVDPEHAMRVADIATAGECRIGRSTGSDVQLVLRVASNSSARGISSHLSRGNPMSTVEVRGVFALPSLISRRGFFDVARISSRLSLNKMSRNAAHAIAASASLGTIAVENAAQKTSAWAARGWIDRHQLIHTEPQRQPNERLRRREYIVETLHTYDTST